MKLLRPHTLPSVVDARVDAIARQRVGGRIEEAFFVPGESAEGLDQQGLLNAVGQGLGPDFEASFERPEALSFSKQGGLLRPCEVVGLEVEHFGSEGARVQLVYKAKRLEQWLNIGSLGFTAIVFGTLCFSGLSPVQVVAALGLGVTTFLGAAVTGPILDRTIGRAIGERRLADLRASLLGRLGSTGGRARPGEASALRRTALRTRTGFSTASRVHIDPATAERFDPRRVRALMGRLLPGAVVDEAVESDRVAVTARRYPFQVPDHLEVKLHRDDDDAALETRQRTRWQDAALTALLPLFLMLVLMGVATEGFILVILAMEIPVVSYLSLRWAQRMRERRLEAFEQALLEDLLRPEPEEAG